ncbi:MAG TPA: DUF4388 domain-containing protein [Thermomicrobiales bacterium]|nr:DUF4388 domain-containing protein [Thermomicrobiales bacterium]
MATIGELSDFSVADLMTVLSQRKRTGRLCLKSGGSDVAMFFENGQLVRVSSGDIALRIGRMLVRQGLLETSKLLEALHMQAESKDAKPLGEVLLERGWITEADLQRCLEEQSIEILSRAMSAGPGIFTFDGGMVLDSSSDLAPLEPLLLLQIAEERKAALAVIQDKLPNHLTPIFLNVAGAELAEIQLNVGPPEVIVLSLLRTGPKTYPELAAQSALDELTLGVAVITLLELGAILTSAQLKTNRSYAAASVA